MSSPSPPPLEPTELAILRQRLSREVQRLRDHIAQLSMYRVRTGDLDAADLTASSSEGDTRQLMANRAKKTLHCTEAALRRIREGSFGVCRGCGRNIEPERLRTAPTSTECVSCTANR